jgi:hypothetical protein
MPYSKKTFLVSNRWASVKFIIFILTNLLTNKITRYSKYPLITIYFFKGILAYINKYYQDNYGINISKKPKGLPN